MKKRTQLWGILVAAAILAGCSTNGSSINPGVTRGNLNNDKLQFAVGTARIFDGAIGLNVVTTFRQPNGLSAVLLDSPTITGPAGFVVTGAAPSGDAGTNHISASPQTAPTPYVTTFGIEGGAFKYGFAPYNSDNQGNPYPNGPGLYPVPFYIDPTLQVGIAGGPPAYPFFNDGTFISGFPGYSQGFNAFETPVVAGAYSISVVVPGPNGPAATFTGTATIASTVPLPTLGAPVFVSDGTGGGALTVAVPADPRIVETLIYVADTSSGNYFTIGPLAGTGSLGGSLPDKLGPCSGQGCQNGPNATQSLNTGDTYTIYAISYDYPSFEASPPGSTSQMPAIVGVGGQADISMSPLTNGTY